ncbi:uncharacterized protein N7483_008676 [Penicillium malachiteum]|uniref:uncharacterized protein n=1 Tax=Penicillium malachiteum TaxID=1324776 RepID=UPI0025477D46|nr:uncharacterized protein N7483_008676 [Penicillium malachiteum]KAJ5720742.1 hypothetical protein N7483_008676 [Penicillium malachiteum]
MTVLDNCNTVIFQINRLLEHNPEDGESSKAASGWKHEMAAIRMSLATHRISLNLALQLISLSLAKTTQDHTTAIRGEVVSVKQDTGLIVVILEELGRLRSIVANSTASNTAGDQSYILNRYLDSLSSYAESVCDDAVQFSDLSDVSYSNSQPLSEIFESLASNLSTISDARPAIKAEDKTENQIEHIQALTLRPSSSVQQDLKEAPSNQRDEDLKLIAPWNDLVGFEHLPPSKLKLQRTTSGPKKNTKELIAIPAIRHSAPPPAMEDVKQSSPVQNDKDLRPLSSKNWTGFENIQPIMLDEAGRGRRPVLRKDCSYTVSAEIVSVDQAMQAMQVKLIEIPSRRWYVPRIRTEHTFQELNQPQAPGPTIWEEHHLDYTMDGDQFEISLFDTAGDYSYDRLRPHFYPNTHAVVLCFNIDSSDTVDNILEKWQEELNHYCPDVPVILVGLQKDARLETGPRNLGIGDLVTWERGNLLREEIQAKSYLECSSRTGEGVNEVLAEATRIALRSLAQEKNSNRRRSIWPFRRSG